MVGSSNVSESSGSGVTEGVNVEGDGVSMSGENESG